MRDAYTLRVTRKGEPLKRTNMPLSKDISKDFPFLKGREPLTPMQIKMLLLASGVNISELADRWQTTSAVISRVIHRRGEYVYQREREMLARFLGVDVVRVGREPNRESPKSKYAAA